MKYLFFCLFLLISFSGRARIALTELKTNGRNDPAVWPCGHMSITGDVSQMLHTETIPTGVASPVC